VPPNHSWGHSNTVHTHRRVPVAGHEQLPRDSSATYQQGTQPTTTQAPLPHSERHTLPLQARRHHAHVDTTSQQTHANTATGHVVGPSTSRTPVLGSGTCDESPRGPFALGLPRFLLLGLTQNALCALCDNRLKQMHRLALLARYSAKSRASPKVAKYSTFAVLFGSFLRQNLYSVTRGSSDDDMDACTAHSTQYL